MRVFREKAGRIGILLVGLTSGVFLGGRPIAAETLSVKILKACQVLETVRPVSQPGRIEELEIFLLAAAYEELGQSREAGQYYQYLADFYAASPLVSLLPETLQPGSYLSEFNPDPDFSRLVKNAYSDILKSRKSNVILNLEQFARLLTALVHTPSALRETGGVELFLKEYPEAPYAGWAAYQAAWQQRLQSGENPEVLREFWAGHKSHPLGREAREAVEVENFSPVRLARLSSLLPGRGEEILEPGLSVSSTWMYYEALYLAGTIGFALAAQQGPRLENLTGALIFANLLILNHRSSAEKTYYMARRRNQAERRKFILDRLEKPITGTGRFNLPSKPKPEAGPCANDLLLSLCYQTGGVAEGFRHSGIIREDELTNLGFRAEYVRSALDIWRSGKISLGLALAPFARCFFNQAGPAPGRNPDCGMKIHEAAAGVELACLTRLALGGGWLQARISGGPAWRQRGFSVSGLSYREQGSALSGSLDLAWGGASGTYWRVGVVLDDSFQSGEVKVADQTLAVPSISLGIQFGLGVRF